MGAGNGAVHPGIVCLPVAGWAFKSVGPAGVKEKIQTCFFVSKSMAEGLSRLRKVVAGLGQGLAPWFSVSADLSTLIQFIAHKMPDTDLLVMLFCNMLIFLKINSQSFFL